MLNKKQNSIFGIYQLVNNNYWNTYFFNLKNLIAIGPPILNQETFFLFSHYNNSPLYLKIIFKENILVVHINFAYDSLYFKKLI